MDKYAIVSFHTVDKNIGQFIFPKLIDWLVVCSFKRHAMLHTIRHDAIHRPKHSIEKAGNPEMFLGILQGFFSQSVGAQLLLRLAIVGKYGRHLLCSHKIMISLPVFRSYLVAAIKLPSQFLYIQLSHFCSQHFSHRLEKWL